MKWNEITWNDMKQSAFPFHFPSTVSRHLPIYHCQINIIPACQCIHDIWTIDLPTMSKGKFCIFSSLFFSFFSLFYSFLFSFFFCLFLFPFLYSVFVFLICIFVLLFICAFTTDWTPNLYVISRNMGTAPLSQTSQICLSVWKQGLIYKQ